MGTLFNQRPRSEAVHSLKAGEIATMAKELMHEHSINWNQAMDVIREERMQKLNQYQIHDYDVKDEQLAGFGELLKSTNCALDEIGRALMVPTP